MACYGDSFMFLFSVIFHEWTNSVSLFRERTIQTERPSWINNLGCWPESSLILTLLNFTLLCRFFHTHICDYRRPRDVNTPWERDTHTHVECISWLSRDVASCLRNEQEGSYWVVAKYKHSWDITGSTADADIGHSITLYSLMYNTSIYINIYIYIRSWTPLWSSGQSSWLQIQTPGFDSRHYQKKKSSGSGTGSTQPREYNWGATW
jgi:hypothetical protein